MGMGVGVLWEEQNLPSPHQPKLGHPHEEQGWKKASLCLSQCQPHTPLALLALPCSISRASPTQSPPSSRGKKNAVEPQPQPHWSKTPEMERAGIPPLWHPDRSTHSNITRIFQLCYLFASTPHSLNFPEDKVCPIPNNAWAGNMKGKIVVAAPGAF